jgi:chitinase
MFLFRLLTVITLIKFVPRCQADFNVNLKTNVALYWVRLHREFHSSKKLTRSQGQGASQNRLSYFCSQTTIDIIPIAFVDIFPAQGNGFPGTNFGNQCWGRPYVYAGPGNNPSLNQLQSECPQVGADIPICQSTYGKKIILSLGGGTDGYQLSGAANGVAFADFLWGAFGPQTQSWLNQGMPRPFDEPNNAVVEVDGFDFDIELPSPGKNHIRNYIVKF